MVVEISDEQRNEYKEAFSLFDKTGNGVISVQEFKNLMNALDQELSEAEIKQMMNSEGHIDFGEFVALMARQVFEKDTEEELRVAFKIIDSNDNGVISASELKAIMISLGENLTDEEINDMIVEADFDRDGVINYDEFVYMIAKS